MKNNGLIEADVVSALNSALFQLMAEDNKVVVLGEDVGVDGGVFRVTKGLIKKFPKRVFDTPLSESGIIGSALGLCVAGYKPVAEIQFSGFAAPAFDQLISHVSRLRNRSRGSLSAPLTIRTPTGGGVFALEHHSESLETIYAHIPGLKVVMCSRPLNAKGLLSASVKSGDPVLFLEPKRIYRSIKEKIPEKPYTIPLGRADVVKEGSDLTIVTYGAMLKDVLEVVAYIKDLSIEVIDLQTIYPLDMETIIASASKTGRLMVINEARGFLNLACEIIVNAKEHDDKIKASRVTAPDTIVPLGRLEKYYIPSKARIYREILRFTK